jgi:hypothetical protein
MGKMPAETLPAFCRQKVKEMIAMIFDTTLNAVGAWLIISPTMVALLYAALEPVLVRIQARSRRLKLIRR